MILQSDPSTWYGTLIYMETPVMEVRHLWCWAIPYWLEETDKSLEAVQDMGEIQDREQSWTTKRLSLSAVKGLVKVPRNKCAVTLLLLGDHLKGYTGSPMRCWLAYGKSYNLNSSDPPHIPYHPWCLAYASRRLRDRVLFRFPCPRYRMPRLFPREGHWRWSESSCWVHYSLVSQK